MLCAAESGAPACTAVFGSFSAVCLGWKLGRATLYAAWVRERVCLSPFPLRRACIHPNVARRGEGPVESFRIEAGTVFSREFEGDTTLFVYERTNRCGCPCAA